MCVAPCCTHVMAGCPCSVVLMQCPGMCEVVINLVDFLIAKLLS
jgi:hypothetical protein